MVVAQELDSTIKAADDRQKEAMDAAASPIRESPGANIDFVSGPPPSVVATEIKAFKVSVQGTCVAVVERAFEATSVLTPATQTNSETKSLSQTLCFL